LRWKKKEIFKTIVNELEAKIFCMENVLREFSSTNLDQEVNSVSTVLDLKNLEMNNARTELMDLMAKRVDCDLVKNSEKIIKVQVEGLEGEIETKGL